MRIESDRTCTKGGWLHRREDAPNTPLPPREVEKEKTDKELDDYFRPLCERWAQDADGKLPKLAAQLGVSVNALQQLSVGWNGSAWTTPDRNATGLITGVSIRKTNGRKICMPGSRRGLTYGPLSMTGTLLLIEGMSDTATALTMGIACIGRPNNLGGHDQLVPILRQWKGRIIVVGEWDAKARDTLHERHNPNCLCCNMCWPGRYGAKTLANNLWKSLQRRVEWKMPPDGKDIREFFRKTGVNPENRLACLSVGQSLLRRLRKN